MKALLVMPWISTPARMSFARSTCSARQVALDLAQRVLGRDRLGEGPVRGDRVADRRGDRGGVPSLDSVDRQDERQHLLALDAVDLPQVRTRPEVLERGRGAQDPLLAAEREGRLLR